MSKQYTGLVGTKTLLRLLFPDLVRLCDHCSEIHDAAYNQRDPLALNFIHWAFGDDATLKADRAWRACALGSVGHDERLQGQVELGYRACRKWGKMRARLWAWKISW